MAVAIHTSFGCGQSGTSGTTPGATPITAVDQKLAGQWVAEKTNSQGDLIVLNINSDSITGRRTLNVSAVRPTGSSVPVDNGTYSISENQLSFDLNALTDFSTAFTVSEVRLTLGTEAYQKGSGLLSGPHLAGQIQITNTASEEAVGLRVAGSSGGGGRVTAEHESAEAAFVLGEVLVKYKGHRFYEKVRVEKPASDAAALAVASDRPSEAFGAVLATHDRWKNDTAHRVEELRRDPDVEQAITNAILHGQSIPNDPLYPLQWNLELLNMPTVWDRVASGNSSDSDVVVAVIDTGIRAENPDLAGRILKEFGYDWVEGTSPAAGDCTGGDLDRDNQSGPDSDPTDPGDGTPLFSDGNSWHGTHISGIIAALADNAIGIAGMGGSAAVKILPLRTLGHCMAGSTFATADAIRFAAKVPNQVECDLDSTDHINPASCVINSARPKANVINLSLGETLTPASASDMCDAIFEAVEAGVTVVASAGNSSHPQSSGDFYPAACNHTISVGAVVPGLFLASYSNFGPNQDLVAPGGPGGSSTNGILSTIYSGVNDGYGRLEGTSQAAAHVSATAALMISKNTALTPDTIETYLKASAVDLGDVGWDEKFGSGLINPLKALNRVMGSVGSAASLSVSDETMNFGLLGTSAKVLIYSNGPTCTGVKVLESLPWLTPSFVTTAASPWQLTIAVDRTDLAGGSYSGTVTIDSTNCGSKTITVTMTVPGTSPDISTDLDTLRDEIKNLLDSEAGAGDSGVPDFDNSLDVGEIIVLLVDSTEDCRSGEDPHPNCFVVRTDLDANYLFFFAGIPTGSYYLYAGVDENNDGNICDTGDSEPCFSFGNSSNPEAITVSTNTRRNDLTIVY